MECAVQEEKNERVRENTIRRKFQPISDFPNAGVMYERLLIKLDVPSMRLVSLPISFVRIELIFRIIHTCEKPTRDENLETASVRPSDRLLANTQNFSQKKLKISHLTFIYFRFPLIHKFIVAVVSFTLALPRHTTRTSHPHESENLCAVCRDLPRLCRKWKRKFWIENERRHMHIHDADTKFSMTRHWKFIDYQALLHYISRLLFSRSYYMCVVRHQQSSIFSASFSWFSTRRDRQLEIWIAQELKKMVQKLEFQNPKSYQICMQGFFVSLDEIFVDSRIFFASVATTLDMCRSYMCFRLESTQNIRNFPVTRWRCLRVSHIQDSS